jgi:phage-related protein
MTTILDVLFYRSSNGKEPVRDWLKGLSKSEKKKIGEDIKTVQYGWPVGMPVVKNVEKGLWEIRSSLERGEARILVAVKDNRVILLHGFLKKTQKISAKDLEIARRRLSEV